MDLRVGKNYQLVKKIGSGAFGEIYEGKESDKDNYVVILGRHIVNKELVAIKLVSTANLMPNRSIIGTFENGRALTRV